MTDYTLGDTLYHKFTTRAFATGIPTTLSGTPAVQVYENDSVTQITAGITLTADFDSVMGLNHLTIVATGGNGFETNKNYQAVISTGTVGGVSVVGEVVWEFSIERNPAFQRLGAPAGASVSADIATVDSNVDAILVDTGTTLDAALAVVDANVDAILVDTGTTLPATLATAAALATVDTNVDAILVDTAEIGAAGVGLTDVGGLSTIGVNEIRDAIMPTQNATFSNIMFLFVAASDHVTPVTGATGTAVTRSIDGGAFGSGTGTLAEVANGIYQYDASAADMNGGIITLRFTGTGGTPGAPDDRFVTIVTGGGV